MKNVPLEFAHLFEDSSEPIQSETTDEPYDDFVGKFFQDAEFAALAGGGVDVQRFEKECTASSERCTKIYRGIAEKAAKTEKVSDPQKLEKRFSPGPKAGYREYFKSNLTKGKSAAEILNGWLQEFPHRNPDVEKLMREVCAEF